MLFPVQKPPREGASASALGIPWRKIPVVWYGAALSTLLFGAVFYNLYLKPPGDFPSGTALSIKANSTLSEVAQLLKSHNIIRSPFWFRSMVVLTSGERSVRAGDYFFRNPINVFGVAERLAGGVFGLTPVKVVLPEGTSAIQMAAILKNDLENFDSAAFLKLAKADEGYLFPDTYFVQPTATPDEVIALLKGNFGRKIAGISGRIQSFGRPLSDVIIMASILEEEAKTTDSRRTIAGILWKRLDAGIPLQVDAPFEYLLGKTTFELTVADLKTNSPYNTYVNKGLPPAPITNPGLDSILAAVTPIKSPYLYYLSDIHGDIHYAKTYAEHLANKARYLP